MSDRDLSHDPIRSTFSDDPRLEEFVAEFVREAPQCAMSLCEAWRDERLDDLRRIANQIRESGPDCGFEEIADAAAELEEAIDQQAELQRLRTAVESLVDVCRRATT